MELAPSCRLTAPASRQRARTGAAGTAVSEPPHIACSDRQHPAEWMPLKPNLVLRSFRDEADDEACQLLEQRANQFGGGNRSGLGARLGKALIEVFPGHPRGFAAKARLCDEHEIVVVADQDAGDRVIAVVVVTILSVTYHGAAIKAGWLFDLRGAHQ